jgi:hypothetical protein
MSPHQQALHNDDEQFRAAHPGRRAGKSEFIPRSAVLNVLKADRNETIVIGAETQKKAKMLHWAGIHTLVVKHKIPLQPNSQEGTWTTPWGARILFWGMADSGAAELLRGFAVVAAYFDEVATYAEMLPNLTQNVLEPTLATTGGTVTLCGTPSLTRSGPWFEICSGKVPGWSVHHWTMHQNPFWKNPKFKSVDEYLASVRKRNGWDEDDPTYEREYLGLFKDDTRAQVFRYREDRNLRDLPETYDRATWIHTMGVDFGYSPDPCAWVVLASHPHHKEVYVVHAEFRHELSQDQAAEVTRALIHEYKPSQVVGDVGGTGKGYVETYNKRFGAAAGAYIQNAKKADKRASIDLVNTELQTGRLVVARGHADAVGDQMQKLPWKDGHRMVPHPAYPDDMCDALRYALISHTSYAHKPPVVPEAPPRWSTFEQRAAREKQSKQKDWWDMRLGWALSQLSRLQLACRIMPPSSSFALS